MKHIIYLGIIVLSSLTLSSCNKWLDIEPKGKVLLTTAEEYGLLFDNITSYPNTDVAYLDDERWRNASNITSVWNTWNLTAANMLYLDDQTYDRSFNANGNSGTAGSSIYQVLYQRISKVANTIIYEKDNMRGTEQEVNSVVAEAKMLRALSYFLLINFYAKPYDANTAADDGGVPLKLDPFIEEEPNPAKSTVQQVYNQIEKDIEEALPDLNTNAKSPYRFNKAAAYALKAKVHLFKREFDACIEAALQSNNSRSEVYNLVELVNPNTQRPVEPLLADGKENLFFATAGSLGTYIGKDLVDLLNEGLTLYGQSEEVRDVRLDLYKRPAETIADYQYMLQWVPAVKEYSPNAMGLTTVEVMLMLAESYARKGDKEQMKAVLKPYLESRYLNYSHETLNLPDDKVALVNFVVNERRKELTKGANRFLDLRRLNMESEFQTVPSRLFPADTEASPNVPQQNYSLPVKSPLYILPFPSKVLENDLRLESNTW